MIIHISPEHMPEFMVLVCNMERAREHSLSITFSNPLHVMQALSEGVDPSAELATMPSRHRLWCWIEERYPQAVGKRCGLSLENPLQPELRIGDEPFDTPSTPGQVHLSSDQEQQLLELIDSLSDERSKSYASYRVWTRLAGWYPQVAKGDWAIRGANSRGIFLIPAEPMVELN